MLDAVSMKLESIAEARSGSAQRLTNAEIVGSYTLTTGPGAGATVTILEKEGRLMQHMDGFPDGALIFLNGNRYRPEALPDRFFTSFRMKNGKTELLFEAPLGPPTIGEKR